MNLDEQQLGYIVFLALIILLIVPILRIRKTSKRLTLRDFLKPAFHKSDKLEAAELLSENSAAVKPPVVRKQRNGTKSDLYVIANAVLNVAKINKWFVIMPAGLTASGITLNLSGIVITRCSIIGFHCLGFGGTITNHGEVWKQSLNGQSKKLSNIADDCAAEQLSLDAFLQAIGVDNIPTKVVALFTTPGVSVPEDGLCYTKDSFADFLNTASNMSDTGIHPSELGKKISSFKTK